MNLKGQIVSAENQYKQLLENFFISVYDEKSLPSHGIQHHQRVWKYIKELISAYPLKSPDFPSKLIIACYMHDIGMTIDPGIRHGRFSRELCIKFLSLNKLDEKDYTDVLNAVENHDRKDYTDNVSTNNILAILSVADDLDAFGFTGIYRYTEIYLRRGIKPEELGHLIIKNAASRFVNFVNTFGSDTALVNRHQKRYEILTGFFRDYNREVVSYNFSNEKPAAYCGVIDLLICLIRDRKDPSEFFSEVEQNQSDTVIRWYFDGLRSELKLIV